MGHFISMVDQACIIIWCYVNKLNCIKLNQAELLYCLYISFLAGITSSYLHMKMQIKKQIAQQHNPACHFHINELEII